MQPNAPDEFRRIKEGHQAREILRVLASDAGGRANDRVLTDYLDMMALGGSREQIRSVIDRLERMGLLRTQTVESVVVASLTEEGHEVAMGKRRVEGVARPDFGLDGKT